MNLKLWVAQKGVQGKDDRNGVRQCIGARCKVETRHSGTGDGGGGSG